MVDKMTQYDKAMKRSDANFKQIIGITKKTFDTMVEILHEAYAAKHTRETGALHYREKTNYF